MGRWAQAQRRGGSKISTAGAIDGPLLSDSSGKIMVAWGGTMVWDTCDLVLEQETAPDVWEVVETASIENGTGDWISTDDWQELGNYRATLTAKMPGELPTQYPSPEWEAPGP